MISALIQIRQVEYEATFCRLYPTLMDHLDRMKPVPFLTRLLRNLGYDSQQIGMELLTMFSQDRKNQLLLYMAEMYQEMWVPSILDALARDETYGKHIRIQSIYPGQNEAGQLYIKLDGIEADYKELASCVPVGQTMGKLLGFAAKIASNDTLENQLLALLRRPESKRKIIDLVETALFKNGVFIKLEDVSFQQENAPEVSLPFEKKPFPKDLENALADVLAEYLRQHK